MSSLPPESQIDQHASTPLASVNSPSPPRELDPPRDEALADSSKDESTTSASKMTDHAHTTTANEDGKEALLSISGSADATGDEASTNPKHAEELPLSLESLDPGSDIREAQSPLTDVDDSGQPPAPPPKDDIYLDPTPKTPTTSGSPSTSLSYTDSMTEKPKFHDGNVDHDLQPESLVLDVASGDKQREGDVESRSEIQSIMDQFEEGGGGPGPEEVMSPREEMANLQLSSPIQHPPRKSSLEHINLVRSSSGQDSHFENNLDSPSSPGAEHRVNRTFSPTASPTSASNSGPHPSFPPRVDSMGTASPAPQRHANISVAPPPQPDPEPDLPFDFHRFLEQLRHRTADPVAKYLRSFLAEFGKKPWMVHEQVKIIGDFLAFITNKMAQCEVWRGVSDAEFDNAREGMEKLVMNRLYTQTFSPAIPPAQPLPQAKSKRKQAGTALGPGRKGQHQEDVERDDVLAQKVSIYGWVEERHLDIPAVGDGGRRFLTLAQKGSLRNSKSDQSADSFVPLLIYVVLHANPEHLVSNVQYILRFRDQEKLGGEAGYYISSLMGAIQFIENLDRTNLTVTDEEFEKNVESAVSAIAERHSIEEASRPLQVQVPEKSAISRPEVTPRNSMDGEWSMPRGPVGPVRDSAGASAEGAEDNAAVTGLLRTIQRPLSSIGRIFSEDNSSSPQTSSHRASRNRSNHPVATPLPGNTPRLSPALLQPPRASDELENTNSTTPAANTRPQTDGPSLTAEEAAARQASAEAAEAQKIQRVEHATVVETLSGMFPDLDKEIIDDVVRAQQGRVGRAVDACLALSQ
ncbi:MAG: hypothetical protein M1825_003035 [Sarcosagium campestre]|nr:MAG: hypothetical protein M1825_003035 [Sarcosagium campestre]